jgi:hypothetical protein
VRPRGAHRRHHCRHRQRPCTCRAPCALQDTRRHPLPHVPRRLRAGAAGKPRERPARSRRDGRALRPDRRGRRRPHGRTRRAARVRPHP